MWSPPVRSSEGSEGEQPPGKTTGCSLCVPVNTIKAICHPPQLVHTKSDFSCAWHSKIPKISSGDGLAAEFQKNN